MYAVAKPEDFTKSLVPYYRSKADEMRELINAFEEKTKLGLWWDSKVPEESKVKELSKFWKMLFTNISYFKVSDRDDVIEEVEKYFTLYEDVEKIAQEINKTIEEKGINESGPQMDALRLKLKEAIKKARDEKDSISSSAVYNAQLDLISQQEKTVVKLTSIQLEITQERLLTVAKDLEKSKRLSEGYRQRVDTLQQENEERKQESREMKQQLDELTQRVERMMQPSSSLSEVCTISRSSSISSDIEIIGRR